MNSISIILSIKRNCLNVDSKTSMKLDNISIFIWRVIKIRSEYVFNEDML